MPAQHTVFCELADKMEKLERDAIFSSGHLQSMLIEVVKAQAKCIDALNSRLHRLEDQAHEFDPHRPLG